MRSAAFILLACLLSVDVKGMSISPRGRCQCTDAGVNFIRPKEIEKIEVYSPSSSCERMEIIVTLKESAEQRCLNSESKFAQNFIKNAQKKNRKLE
ncbi:C-X-C motif chemokine 11-6-like [Megalops cyprinoides]|uniref:C-X-C motif chemokine 11-6-like n=1 Tax=Megalops cyprinoides TaxID=118141 RepID=UPI001863D47F|nr:C-X-C motif chemokine 11-6-like [Megalops cyprinoides]